MIVTMTAMFLFLFFMAPVALSLHIKEPTVTCMNPKVEESQQIIDISFIPSFKNITLI